jgi:hypothetical protein
VRLVLCANDDSLGLSLVNVSGQSDSLWDDVLQLLVVARFWSPHSTRAKILAWLHLSLHTRTRAAELFYDWPAQHWCTSHNFIIAEYKMPRDLGDTAAPRHRSHNHEFLRPAHFALSVPAHGRPEITGARFVIPSLCLCGVQRRASPSPPVLPHPSGYCTQTT